MEADSRDVFVAAFEGLTTPVCLSDFTGRVVTANRAFCELVQRSPEELAGALALAFVHPDDWFALVADVLSLLEGRAAYATNERRHLLPDGSEIRMTVTVSLVPRDEDGPLVMSEVARSQEVASPDDLVLARARAIHDAVQQGVSLHDGAGNLVAVTERVEHLLGRTSHELLGRRWTDATLRPISPTGDPLHEVDDPVQEAIDRGRVVERTIGLQCPENGRVWVAVKATPLPGGGAVSSLGDLTDLVTAEEDRARLAGIVHRTADLVFMWSRGSRLTYVNDTARQVLGLTPGDDLASIDITDLFPTAHQSARNRGILRALLRVGRWTGDAEMLTPGGRRMPVSVVVLAEMDDNGRFSRFSAVAHDLTSRVQLEAELEHRATRDPLTGLANRWLLHDQLECFLARGSVTVVYLDLDDFKVVNDSLGHAAGDQLLIDVARCLQGLAPGDALVSRLGGDEFLVVLPEGWSPDALVGSLPAALGELGVRASVGVATACRGDDGAALLDDADRAMYSAKGRDPFRS